MKTNNQIYWVLVCLFCFMPSLHGEAINDMVKTLELNSGKLEIIASGSMQLLSDSPEKDKLLAVATVDDEDESEDDDEDSEDDSEEIEPNDLDKAFGRGYEKGFDAGFNKGFEIGFKKAEELYREFQQNKNQNINKEIQSGKQSLLKNE